MSREMKTSRQRDYKRRWISASRNLAKQRKIAEKPGSNSDGDEEIQLSTLNFSEHPSSPNSSFSEIMTNNISSPSRSVSGTIDHVPYSDQSDGPAEWIDIDEEIRFSSDSECESDHEPFADQLTEWALEWAVQQNCLDSLLKLLKNNGHPELPSTARTLLSTDRYVEVSKKSDMEYHYFGVEQQLVQHYKTYPLQTRAEADTLEISLNVDGLPLYRSSNISLWPVQCAIVNLKPIIVFPVALTCGKSKPSNLDFLSDTIQDMNVVLQHGIKCDDEIVKVTLRCIVCDAPARAMVKNVKLYSGYGGCDKCSQHGEYHGRVTYQETKNLDLRTDDTFRKKQDKEHQPSDQTSPFCELPIDMIKAFPIDYMHQVCLGAMRRLLLVWIRGKRDVKHSSLHISLISSRLEEMKKSFPSTFARKPRSLDEVDRWKATEYRQFLLYSGKLVLKGILRPDLYDSFMNLSVGISILVSPTLASNPKYRDYAHDLLEHFVSHSRTLYGKEFLVYNIHSLLHLADEAQVHGSLDACSAFPFENYLYQVKKLVRTGNKPMKQIVRRLHEKSKHAKPPVKSSSKISLTPPNNAFVLDEHMCAEVVAEEEDGIYLCRVYEQTEPLFTSPCDSKLIKVYQVHRTNAHMRNISKEELVMQAIRLKEDEKGYIVFMGLLHEIY